MDQAKAFFNKTLFQVDGMTFTVGIVIVVLVVAYFVWFKK